MKIGDRVKLSDEGKRQLYPETQERLGTVTSITGGLSKNKVYVGVLRDGCKSSERYWIGFWEVV